MLQTNIYRMRLSELFLAGTVLFLAACGGQESTENINSMEDIEPTTEEVEEPKVLPMEYVTIETSKGNISLELDPNKAPITVENFLNYVDQGFYDGTIFHRVISNFMIQGGGMTPDGERKETDAPIILESDNGLSNDVGTVAMARTNAPNSATAQFFINVTDNHFLNYSPNNPGYAVFGRVTSGMEVVNEIRQVETGVFQGMRDWPVETVEILSVKRDS